MTTVAGARQRPDHFNNLDGGCDKRPPSPGDIYMDRNKKTLIAAAVALIGVTLFTFGQPKEKLAAHWTQQGRQAERAGAYKEAFEDYRKAEAFADDAASNHPELHAALLEKLGDMSVLNGNRTNARRYFQSSYEAWSRIGGINNMHSARVARKAASVFS